MTIPHELVQAIAEGSAVLFIGAGLSQGAGLPGWSDLLEPLADEIGLPPDQRGDLPRVARLVERQLTRRVLIDRLLRATDTTGKGPTANHLRLARLGLDTWITTNYDDLLEQTLRQAGQPYVKVVQDADLSYTRPDAATLIKVHGDREQKNTIVLTGRDYETAGQRYRRVREKLSVLLIERTVLFVGYRVNDPDFNQVRSEIAADLREHDRCAYAVVFEGDRFALDELRDRNIEPIVVETAGPEEYNARLGEWLEELIERVESASAQGRGLARPAVWAGTAIVAASPPFPSPLPNLPPNPFTDIQAIRAPARSIGREAEMRLLQALLQGGSVVLLGEPKVGKSSLLYRLARDWAGTVIGPLDCQGLQDRDDLYACIAEALDLPDGKWRTVRLALHKAPLLLLVDELDAGGECGLTHRDLGRLRSVADHNRGFRLVAASRTPLKKVFGDPGQGSPAYNFLQPLTLGPLAEPEAYALLAHPWVPGAPAFVDETRARLVERAGCHPFRLQRAAFHRYEALADVGYDWQAAYARDMEQML